MQILFALCLGCMRKFLISNHFVQNRFGCACAYFLLGAMCLDRFTARAFLADDDQVAAAVNATTIRDTRRRGSFDSYDNAGRANEGYSQGGAYHAPNAPYTPERSYA